MGQYRNANTGISFRYYRCIVSLNFIEIFDTYFAVLNWLLLLGDSLIVADLAFAERFPD